MTGYDLAWRPAPPPPGVSEKTRRHIVVANLIPAGWWASYGDVGEAASGSGRGAAAALSSVSPLTGAADDTDLPATWTVPWHRIRMADGTLKSREAEAQLRDVRTRRDFVNGLFRAEGGVMSGYTYAAEACHFNLVGHVRRLRLQGQLDF